MPQEVLNSPSVVSLWPSLWPDLKLQSVHPGPQLYLNCKLGEIPTSNMLTNFMSDVQTDRQPTNIMASVVCCWHSPRTFNCSHQCNNPTLYMLLSTKNSTTSQLKMKQMSTRKLKQVV